MRNGEDLEPKGTVNNKAEEIRQLLPSVAQEIQLQLAQDTTLSDEIRQCVEAVLMVSPDAIMSDILDRSRRTKGIKTEKQIRAALNQRILKEVLENLTADEISDTSALTEFLRRAVLFAHSSFYK